MHQDPSTLHGQSREVSESMFELCARCITTPCFSFLLHKLWTKSKKKRICLGRYSGPPSDLQGHLAKRKPFQKRSLPFLFCEAEVSVEIPSLNEEIALASVLWPFKTTDNLIH